MISIGFKESLFDQSLFSYSVRVVKAFFLIYVDNIILALSSKEFSKEFFGMMGKEFPVKDIEDLKFILGMHVNKLPNGSLLFSQHKYLANMLHLANLGNLKSELNSSAGMTFFD